MKFSAPNWWKPLYSCIASTIPVNTAVRVTTPMHPIPTVSIWVNTIFIRLRTRGYNAKSLIWNNIKRPNRSTVL